jgi:hypothetical protein
LVGLVLCFGGVGRSATAGKTSLIKRYVHNIAPSKEHHTTIGVEFSLKTLKVEDEIVNVQVWCVCVYVSMCLCV